MKDRMDHPENEELDADQDNSANKKPAGVDSTRRRLFGAGVAAPIILSMSSRTAWGGGLCGPSAFNSMTFSSHAPQAYVDDCTAPAGKGPFYWKNNPLEWVGYVPGALLDGGTLSPLSGGGLTMSDVLDGVGSDATASIEAHGIAALLNVSKNLNLFGQPSPAVAANLVQNLFVGFISDGSATLPNSSTVVYWSSGSYPMQSYFTNYA